ncbi:MAG: tRNA (5-methylaminomethyl-2-thiouridine)(34)-methyltransferase MnmD [Paludibacter sp.]|nr:tRNA (5-methylaminomethyl-2-thiouridine)(34)-methyltransferase MnmD [Paludibacter sp.]
MNTIITTTDDGSPTLYVPEIQEHYHSTFGALQESEHIFINAGLRNCNKKEITVFEVGLGTGLNALLTLIEAEKSSQIVDYKTIEFFPLENDIIENLCFFENNIYQNYFQKIHQSPWNEQIKIADFFYLTKINADFATYECNFGFDVCYFDAFSPEKQPEMWQPSRFDMLYRAANQHSTLTTYCAKGQVRRNLQTAGFAIERLKGAKGKREFLRATKY